MSLYLNKNGKIVINAQGHVIDCTTGCPCDLPIEPEPLLDVEQVFADVVEHQIMSWTDPNVFLYSLSRFSNDYSIDYILILYDAEKPNIYTGISVGTDYYLQDYAYLHNNSWRREFFLPLDNCKVYALKLDSGTYKILQEAYDNLNGEYIVSSDLNTNYTKFPMNVNDITITVSQRNISLNNLILQIYCSNVGDITTTVNNTTYHQIYAFKYNTNLINAPYDNLNIDDTVTTIGSWKILKKVWDSKQYFCDRILTGTTAANWIREGNLDTEGDFYNCGKIFEDGDYGCIYLTFINNSIYATVPTTNSNKYVAYYNKSYLNCTCEQLGTGPVLTSYTFTGIEHLLLKNLSTYVNNTLTKLTDDNSRSVVWKTSGSCNNNVIWEGDGLTARYAFYTLCFNNSENPHFGAKISALFGDTIYSVSNQDVTYSNGQYKVGNRILSGSMLMLDGNSTPYLFTWRKGMTKIPPYTSAMINGTKVQINGTANFIDVTDIELVPCLTADTSYNLPSTVLYIGQLIYRDINARIEKCYLTPSCYWNSSLLHLSPYTSAMLDAGNIAFETGGKYWTLISQNGTFKSNVDNNNYTLTLNSIIIAPKGHFFIKNSQNKIYEIMPRTVKSYYYHADGSSPGWYECPLSSNGGTLCAVYGNRLYLIHNGWMADKEGAIASCAFEDGHWNIYSFNGSVWNKKDILTGGTSEQPPPYYFDLSNEKFYNIFSGSYVYLPYYSSWRCDQLRNPLLFDSEFGFPIVPEQIQTLVKDSNKYDRVKNLQSRFLDKVYNDLNKLKFHSYRIGYGNSNNKLWNEVGRDMTLDTVANYNIKYHADKFETIFQTEYFCAENQLQKEGNNYLHIFKLHLNSNENTENYTGVYCEILTAIALYDFDTYDHWKYTTNDPNNDTVKENGLITANLQLDTLYNIGLTPWDMSKFGNNRLKTFFNVNDLDSIRMSTVSSVFNLAYEYCEIDTIAIIRPIRLLKGSYTSSLNNLIVPDTISSRIIDINTMDI